MADRGGDRPLSQAEAGDEAAADVAVPAVAGDDCDLGDVGGRIGAAETACGRHPARQPLGDDPPRHDPDHGHLARPAGNGEVGGRDRHGLHAVEADRRNRAAPLEERRLDDAAGGDDGADGAGGEVVEEDDVGPPPRRDHAAVAEAEGHRRRPGRRPVDVVKRPAEADQRADHVVEMAVLGDVERVAVVGAEAHEARGVLVEHLGKRMEVLRHRAFADEDGHPLPDLLAGFRRGRGLVVGADAGGEVAVERLAAKERRVAVDVAVLEGQELVEDRVLGGEHARKVHELGEADHLRMGAERQEVGGEKLGARGLEGGRGHAGGELDAKVHHRRFRRGEEVADALGAEHVGDLVRVADRGGDAVRQDQAVELGRGDQRGFDVEGRVDEAGDGEAPGTVDLAPAGIGVAGADDAVADDGDIGRRHAAGDDVEEADILDDEVGRLAAFTCPDRARERCPVGHDDPS